MKPPCNSPNTDFEQIMTSLRPTAKEIENLRKMEHAGNDDAFQKAIRAFDKKYATKSIFEIPGLERHKATAVGFNGNPTVETLHPPSALARLITNEQMTCNCIVPFTFESVHMVGALNDESQYEVRDGILGVVRRSGDQFTLTNPGTVSGKVREVMSGSIHIAFGADLPYKGPYFLIMPVGDLWIFGRSRVVGHGNRWAVYDAKVWVRLTTALLSGGSTIEFDSSQVHYDGTRSEDRSTSYAKTLPLPPRYVAFNAEAGDKLRLEIRLDLDCEANEDGIAIAIVDYFGFPAVTAHDYDSIVIFNG